jgi:hypothetical protein
MKLSGDLVHYYLSTVQTSAGFMGRRGELLLIGLYGLGQIRVRLGKKFVEMER